MHLRAPAIVCAARPHGETAVIARVLTADPGIIAGYVAGGRGRVLRPVLIPGNLVEADLRARSDSQLPFLRLELVHSRGPWLAEPLAAAAIAWVTALVATALPERQRFAPLHQALGGLLDAINATADWARANPEELAQTLAGITGVPLPAQRVSAARGTYAVQPMSDAIIARQQSVADTIAALRVIPARIDVRAAVWRPERPRAEARP